MENKKELRIRAYYSLGDLPLLEYRLAIERIKEMQTSTQPWFTIVVVNPSDPFGSAVPIPILMSGTN